MKIVIGLLCCILSSCTVSIIMNHTEGQASDMVDTQQSASPDVQATANIPLKG